MLRANPSAGTGGRRERFRHAHVPEELSERAPRIRAMAEPAREAHVLFGNRRGDAAVRAAEAVRRLPGLS